jgi:hypothetical protein
VIVGDVAASSTDVYKKMIRQHGFRVSITNEIVEVISAAALMSSHTLLLE